MKTIKKTFLIKAPVDKVWQALVDPDIIEDWGGGPVNMSDEEGFEFELWGGDINGKNIKVVFQEELVQEWMARGWDLPSKVIFTLSEKDNKTTVDILHEDIPDSEVEEIDNGWKASYMGSLKEYVEKFL